MPFFSNPIERLFYCLTRVYGVFVMIECEFFFFLILIWIFIITGFTEIIVPRKLKLVVMKTVY
jgi:hypothetical protein